MGLLSQGGDEAAWKRYVYGGGAKHVTVKSVLVYVKSMSSAERCFMYIRTLKCLEVPHTFGVIEEVTT